jgi:hypothetical protein
MQSGIEGAIKVGTLKDANIVTLSLRQNKVYEILGIWRVFFAAFAAAAVTAAEAVGWQVVEGLLEGPKIFANRASLYTQIDIFTVVVARNLAVPGVTVEKG